MPTDEELKKVGLTRDVATGFFRDPKGELVPSLEFFIKSEAISARRKASAEIEKSRAELAKQGGQDTSNAIIDPVIPLDIDEQTGDTPDIGDAKGRDAFYQQLLKDYQEELDDLKKEREDRQKTFDADKKKKQSTLDKFLGRGEQREQEFEDIGVEPDKFFQEQKASIAEIGALMTEFDNLTAKKDIRIAEIESMAIIQSAQQVEKIKAEKQFNIELSQKASQINTKLAIQEMKNNNFEQARDFVNTAISDYEFELRLELDEYETFLDVNEEAISELENEERDIINETFNLKTAQFQEEDARLKAIGNLMLSDPTAGITFNDTLQEATEKASGVRAIAPIEPTAPLTSKEQKELEAAGLLDAPRQEQVEFLFPLEEEFITSEFLIKTFTTEELEKQAKEAGFKIKRRFRKDLPDVASYINNVMERVNLYRTSGFTDKEILKLMGK